MNPRRGVSTLFVIGCVLWALVFAGVLVLRYLVADADSAAVDRGEELRERPGVLVEDESGSNGEADLDREPIDGGNADDSGDGSPKSITLSGWDPNGIADFELVERSGRKVTKADLLGKPWVVCFVFTRCPGPCPRVSKVMYELQQATKSLDMRLVTITVDPEHDTPEVLRRYAEAYGADEERWLYLTGDEQEVYPLIASSFRMPVQRVATQGGELEYDVIHTTNVLYVDETGVVRAKYNSVDTQDLEKLKARLRKEVRRIPDGEE